MLSQLSQVTKKTQFFPQKVLLVIYGKKRGFPFHVSALPLLAGNANTLLGRTKLIWQLTTRLKAPLHDDSDVRILRIGVGDELFKH